MLRKHVQDHSQFRHIGAPERQHIILFPSNIRIWGDCIGLRQAPAGQKQTFPNQHLASKNIVGKATMSLDAVNGAFSAEIGALKDHLKSSEWGRWRSPELPKPIHPAKFLEREAVLSILHGKESSAYD